MINIDLSFSLPSPWDNQSFETNQVGPINYLVGPNGSGKSQFASALRVQLNLVGNVRLLGTDRLRGMEQYKSLDRITGDAFGSGFAKSLFGHLKEAGALGSGIDTIVLLEERMDLRIQVEATLSHLFDREITLEWDSGNLVGKVRRRGDSKSYRLDREECHGIKELLVLLAHLYNDEYSHIIIDEPELNLHPQYQAFFMQEVRKLAGDPSTDSQKKIVFLITHSPFILDFRSEDDLKSVISFGLDYSSVPKQIANLNLNMSPKSFSLMGRSNAHHKQLFFSDNPIFVEGILDVQLIAAMIEARGVSVAGAGSCIIEAGGAEEVNHYLELCNGLGKEAHFLYDLDSLFRGNLRACIREDQSIQSFLASAGLGNDFGRYCGELDRKLTCLIDHLLSETLPTRLTQLGDFLRDLDVRPQGAPRQLAKARIAVMTAISKYRNDVVSVASQQLVEDIEGHRKQILTILKKKNINVLPGGTLERYLPHYMGHEYHLKEEIKRKAVNAEIEELANLSTEEELSSRYGELYNAVCALPSKADVDVDPVIRTYLSDYIHQLQKTVIGNPSWGQEQIQDRLNILEPSLIGVFSIGKLERGQQDEFSATIEIAEMLEQRKRFTQVDHRTNAGMGEFKIDFAD